MQPPSIHFEDVTLTFNGTKLFDRFSVVVPGGRCTCLLGPSGCGKSTLLGLVSGNSALNYSGRIHFSPESDMVHSIGWMAQADLLLPWLTVLDNVMLGARLRNEVSPNLVKKAEGLLREAGLEGLGSGLPKDLSGGMRQRVALLRTLMEERPVILMDEPFSALDALTRMKLQNLAARLTRGRTVLMVTHDPLEALRLADRILVFGGRPVKIVSVIDLAGEVPRNPQDGELQENYPKLLRQLMGEEGAA
jgi:putative hydroxymethylpyrimidine transport system ATP-binding protein